MKRLLPALLTSAMLLTACAPLEKLFSSAASPQDVSLTLSEKQQWWRVFHDPLMDQLAPQLLEQNIDLKIARERVAEARGLERVANAGFFPDLSLSGSATRSNNAFFVSKPISTEQVGFDASWEVDLFGRIAAQSDAASSRLRAQESSSRDATNTVLADLFRAIIEWRQAQQTITETTSLLQSQQDQISLFDTRVQAGLIEATSLERARAQQAQTAVELPLAQASARIAQYRIERLLGKTSGALTGLFEQQAPLSLNVPVLSGDNDIPIETIRQRPDIRTAYAQMLAAQADLAEAEANLWPKLTLTGFYGARDLPQGVPAAGNPIWTLAAGLSAPLLNFGRLHGAVDASNARSQQASLEYENKVLSALEETRSALSDYTGGLEAVTQQEKALEHRRETIVLARERFTRGLTDMTDLTTAQTELDQATLTLIQRKANTAIAYIRLQKALGVSVMKSDSDR